MLTLPLIWSFSLSDADVHRLLPYLILDFAMQPHANPILYHIFGVLELHFLISLLIVSCVQKFHKKGSLVRRAVDLSH